MPTCTDCTWTMPDGYPILGRVFEPDTTPRALLLYLHGIQSHGGWYGRSAELLAEAGNVVIQPDRRGSGRNERDRGDAASAQVWLDDVAAHLDDAERRWGRLPIGIVGVSWGGKLAAACGLAWPARIQRLLLIAPGIYPAVSVPIGARLRIAGNWLAGGSTRFEIPISEASLFTENPDRQRYILDDPLRLTHATARFLIHSTRLDRRIRKAASGAIPAETTILLAREDRIIENEATASWGRRVADADVQILPGAHTLEFAIDPSLFEARIAKWSTQTQSR